MRNSRSLQSAIATRQGRGSRFWAWTVSIVFHLILLTVFGLAKFSQAGAGDKQQPSPMASINQIKKASLAKSVIPKPKVKRPAESRSLKMPNEVSDVNPIFENQQPSSQSQMTLKKPESGENVFSLAETSDFSGETEFFGAGTLERKICYVIDCSGSMRGMLSGVREKLKDSIATLQQDQYFCIIFFGNGRLFEFSDGQMVRATQKAKSSACEFIDMIQPAGQTNALSALERALQVRDSGGHSPAVIYFLTDGFELAAQDSRRFSSQIMNLLRRFAPETKINTIGFWPQSSDRDILEKIAVQSGGEFVFVTDSDYE